MVAVRSPAAAASPPDDGEQRFILHGVSWRDYLVLRDVLDHPGLRMAYCEGTLELMSPSEAHEHKKKLIARLLEIYALERDVPLDGKGSATYRNEAAERGLEPDECYYLGPRKRDVPDIAIEVVIKSAGIDKLSIYRGLGVSEVWFWEGGAFHLHGLGPEGYVEISRSKLVPGLDFDLLATLVRRDDQHQAVREFRDRIREASGGA
jgi:Uma2 family endonuclease